MKKLLEEIRIIKKQNNNEFYYLMFICFIWGNLTVNFGMVFLSRIVGGGPVDSFIIILEVLFVLISAKYWTSRIRFVDLLFIILCITLYLAGFFGDSKVSEIIVKKLSFFLMALVYYFVGVTIDFDKYKNILYWMSLANVLTSSVYYLVLSRSLGANADELGDHNMVASYNILPSVIFVVWHLISKFNYRIVSTYIDIFTSILGVMLVLSFGTRGALVCLLFFIVVYVFFIAKINHAHLIKTSVLLIGLIVYYYLDAILLFMTEFTESFGMSSRIFTMLIDNTFMGGEASTNERVELLNTIKNVINGDPSITLIGKGVFGWAEYLYVYPHNFYYEMVITFGYFLSYLLMTVLSYILIKSLLSKQSDSRKAFLLLTISVGLVKLFMSGSFVDEYFFYLMIGFAVNMTRKIKKYI